MQVASRLLFPQPKTGPYEQEHMLKQPARCFASSCFRSLQKLLLVPLKKMSSLVTRLIFTLSVIAGLALADPLPDTSEKCLSCEAQVSALESTWTNATS